MRLQRDKRVWYHTLMHACAPIRCLQEPDTHDAGQEPLYASFPIIGKTGTFKTRKSSVKDGKLTTP